MRLVALSWITLAATACAHDLHTRMPTPSGRDTGTVVIVLPQPASDLTVAINGTLVAERAHTRKLRVDAVPIGLAEVSIAAGGGPDRVERKLDLIIERGEVYTIPIGSPERSLGGALGLTVLSIGAALLTRAIYLALW